VIESLVTELAASLSGSSCTFEWDAQQSAMSTSLEKHEKGIDEIVDNRSTGQGVRLVVALQAVVIG
jgi:hypothetical protein